MAAGARIGSGPESGETVRTEGDERETRREERAGRFRDFPRWRPRKVFWAGYTGGFRARNLGTFPRKDSEGSPNGGIRGIGPISNSMPTFHASKHSIREIYLDMTIEGDRSKS